MTEPIRVLIADDHPLFRDGLTVLLTDGPDTELAGAATSGTEAVELARETQPDVVVMDLHMPGLDGIEATRRIVADSPHIVVLVLTMFDDDDSIFSALRAGARGYLLKGADQEQIRRAIQAAASGEIIFGTHLAARMLTYFTAPSAPSAPPPVFPQLTEREHEVLDLVAQGRPNTAIAARLCLSEKTIRNHVSNILTKLQVADRAQAIVQARDAGLGQQSRVLVRAVRGEEKLPSGAWREPDRRCTMSRGARSPPLPNRRPAVSEPILAPHTDPRPRGEGRRALPPMVSGAQPLVGHGPQFLRDELRLLERGYREHGEVFRLRLRPGRRPAIVLLGPERARWVFKLTDDHSLAIGPSLAFTRRLFGPDFYYLAEPAEYQHQRETLLPLFRARMIAAHLAIMERHCAEFVARLGDSGTFDLPREMNELVLGIIMEAFLGADFARHMPPTVARDFRDLIRGLDPITPGWVPAPHLVRARRARNRLHNAVGNLVRARRSEPVDPPDFLQVLISSRALDGTPVTDQWVVQMAMGVTFAGHDSTTGHVSWALIDLLQHPTELRKVLAEQDRILPEGTEGALLDSSTVHRMTCLDRALRETSRLRPVAPVLLRRALRPIDLDGCRIPAGADVFVAPVLSHRLPDLFDAATRYDPDRYLAHPEQAGYLHGFSGGTHRCLGEAFARMLTHVAITRLLQHHDLTLVDPFPAAVRTPGFKGPRSPCRIHYQRKSPAARSTPKSAVSGHRVPSQEQP